MPQRKIRVLQLVDNLGVGGAERLVLMLATKTDRERFEVVPCAIRGSGPLEDELKAAGIPYRILGIARRSVLTGPFFMADLRRVVRTLAATVRELSIDVIHAHLIESSLIAVLAARRGSGQRVCATVHSVTFTSKRGCLSPREWLLRTTIDKVFAQVDRIVAVSNGVAKALRLETGLPWDRIMTIPNGVEANPFYVREDKRTLRNSLGLDVDRAVIVSVGRLTREKGYHYLLSALALIPDHQRPLTLIVGDGPERNELESTAKAMKLDRDIRFLGMRRDVSVFLAASDIFVLASLWEGLPLVLLEAMAAGLPAVVTAVGGNPEVIEHGVSGLLVKPGEPQTLVEAISDLLRDPRRRDRMGQAALEQFNQHYSLHGFIEAHEGLYEELAMTGDSGRSQFSI